MVDGLYAGSTYQIADFKTIVFRQQQLGFNAVRLPMTFSDLNLAPKSWTKSCTDDTASLKASPSSSPGTRRVCAMVFLYLQAAAAGPFTNATSGPFTNATTNTLTKDELYTPVLHY